MDDELLKFKEEIRITDVAEYFSYQRAPHKDGRNSFAYLDSGNNLISFFKHRTSGHDMFSNVHDRRESGDLIKFIQREKNMSLGEVRVFCRDWLNEPKIRRGPELFTKPKVSEKDVLNSFDYYSLQDFGYLVDYRKISPEIINSHTFRGTAVGYTKYNREKKRDYHYTAFLIRNPKGVVGLELKNMYFKGTEENSLKSVGLTISNLPNKQSIQTLIITESWEEAMSHMELHPKIADDLRTVYISSNGSPNSGQHDLINQYITDYDPEHIILSNNNDTAGIRFDINYFSSLGNAKESPIKLEAHLQSKHNVRLNITLSEADAEKMNEVKKIFSQFNAATPVSEYINYQKPFVIEDISATELSVLTQNKYNRLRECLLIARDLVTPDPRIKFNRPPVRDEDWNDRLREQKSLSNPQQSLIDERLRPGGKRL